MDSQHITSREFVAGRERFDEGLGVTMHLASHLLRLYTDHLRERGTIDPAAEEDMRRLQVLLRRVGATFSNAHYWHRAAEEERAAQAAAVAARRAENQARLRYVGAIEPPPRYHVMGWLRDSAQRSGAPYIGSAQRGGAPYIDSAQRSGAPFIDSAQRGGAPYIGSAQRSGAPFVDPSAEPPFALTREGGQTIAAVGSTGSGKSQALLCMLDGRLQPVPGLTSEQLPPTAALVVACTPGAVALPELVASMYPNDRAADVAVLRQRLCVEPAGLPPPRLLVPRAEIDEVHGLLRAELGEADARRVEVVPLVLSPRALGQVGLEALLSVDPNDAPDYMNDVLARALELGDDLCHARLSALILAEKGLSKPQRLRALARIAPLGTVLDPSADADAILAPGKLTLAMLCGRGLRQTAALPLLLSLFHAALLPRGRGAPVQRFLGLDEVDILGSDPLLFQALSRLIRRARHLGADLWISGQDLLALPPELLGLVTQFLCFRLRSLRTFLLLRERVAGLLGVPFAAVCDQPPGSALWVPTESTDPTWSGRAASVILRPPRCRHGGATRAVR